MTPDPACCTADTSLPEVARMMVDKDCGYCRRNLPCATRSVESLSLDCRKCLRHNGYFDHILWKRPDYQSDNDMEC